MTLTPLHAAFVWILKPHFKWLIFAALTIGSFVPDLEPLAAFVFGWSVFCGWDFPCSLAPDRLVLHSLVGALTIDVVLTMAIVKALDKAFVMQRLGLHGFSKVKLVSLPFYASAAIGSVSHNLIDWFHHPANPIFWPLPIDGSYYVGGLLLPFFNVLQASIIVGIIAGSLTAATIATALYKSGRNFLFLFANPIAAAAIVTKYLSRNEKTG
jgi:hypothetical protein